MRFVGKTTFMLHAFDLVIIGVYLLVTVAIGLICGGRQRDTSGYFTGGGHMNSPLQAVLVGLSIAATLLMMWRTGSNGCFTCC
jgi:Na+/proline symporter